MKRVLIVDDDEVNLYLLRTVLQGHGFAVEEACDGEIALAKARESVPDLVISDLLMPVMDGYSLLREWRTDVRLRDVPFIVYTATYCDPKDRKLALTLGADAYLLKSIEPAELVARIREVVAGATRTAAPAGQQGAESESQMKQYSEVLIRKLEDKMLLVQTTNDELQTANLLKDAAESELRLALAAVNRGNAPIAGGGDTETDPLAPLTPRQREVLTLIAEGVTTKQMAYQLSVSPKTIEAHRKALMDRLGIRDIAGLVRLAVRAGLVSLDP